MNKFKAGDKVKILGLNSITREYGSSTDKRGMIGSIDTIEYIDSNCEGVQYAVINQYNFDFDDLELAKELAKAFEFSKHKTYSPCTVDGVKIKYIGRAFFGEDNVLVVSDEDGNVSGSSYTVRNQVIDYKMVEISPIVLPDMYEISDSSIIAEIGHNMIDIIFVKFHSGVIYEFADVSVQEFHKFLSAKSKGIFFGAYIRNIKETTKLA